MPRLEIVHKHQTRLNDCWYACIQMIRTWKHDGAKTKAVGAGVRAHRGRGLFGGGFWGWTLGKHSPQWQAILDENELIYVGWDVGTNACASVQKPPRRAPKPSYREPPESSHPKAALASVGQDCLQSSHRSGFTGNRD